MMKTIYRTRPHTVAAMQYVPSDVDQCQAIHDWLGIKHLLSEHTPDAPLEFTNHEGRFLTVNPGEWVVLDGVRLSIVSDQAFRATYEMEDER